MQAYQNLSVTGLPIALTEFGVNDNGGSGTFDWDWTSQIMTETMRMTFGTPDATSFMIWDVISNNASDFGLVDSNYLNPTLAMTRYEQLMDEWDTDMTRNVNPDGTIDFTGFYGDYDVTIDGNTFDLSLLKGTTDYDLTVGDYVLGDYNGNGVVDAADYTTWRDAMQAGTTSLLNEGDSPGTVDENDFLFWRAHFGETLGSGAGGGSAAAVPEPTASLLMLVGSLTLAIAARRKSCSLAAAANLARRSE